MSWLQYAEQGVHYVRTTRGMLAANRQADRMKHTGDLDKAVSNSRVAGIQAGFAAPAVGDERQNLLLALGAEAEAYSEHKAGNCSEMAKVAFVHLAQHYHVRPLELVYLKTEEPINVRLTGTASEEEIEPDHSFVIVGREISASEKFRYEKGYLDMPPYSEWKYGSAICDPWAKRAYAAQHLETEMAKINRVSAGSTKLLLELRIEPGQKWPS